MELIPTFVDSESYKVQCGDCFSADMKASRLGNILASWIPARYIFAVLGSVSFIIFYGLKVNLSMTIVAMVRNTTNSSASEGNSEKSIQAGTDDFDNVFDVFVYDENNGSGFIAENSGSPVIGNDEGYDWNESQQGLILSSYYWGYIISQFPAGRVAEIFSAKWVIFVAVAINIIGTLITPVVAENIVILLIVRCIEGIGGGFSFPAMHVLLSRWAPVEERSIMSSVVYAGGALGTVLSMLFSGLISDWMNWQAVFYIMGGLPLLWCLLWVWLVQDDTNKQQYITEQERTFILKSLGQSQHKVPVPWKEVWTSVPFLVIINTHFCNNVCWYFLLTELPKYMNQILHLNLKMQIDNALLSSLPYLTLWMFSLILSKCVDYGRLRGTITTTGARKISTFIATAIPGACLLAVNLTDGDSTLVAGLMAIAVTAMGAMFSGVLTNHIDIASHFAGTLVGITNTFATIPGILIPIVVGEVTHVEQSAERWGIIFYAIIAVLVFELVVYLLLGSGEEQPWNKINSSGTEKETHN
ncbi:hypothetical protein L9F63_003887 [Diploptera punctata]|uniref:Major facilitator superfamily (MFS) profile domain-containing protein n=1 Tax=Diploptera punctata TaxID=6984 RepID=A0AAD8E988_DIPPU|nr:hypothetical protein L9F63_003887 [Diploptera punctata]